MIAQFLCVVNGQKILLKKKTIFGHKYKSRRTLDIICLEFVLSIVDSEIDFVENVKLFFVVFF